MEKLIELINEHQKEKHQDGFYIPVVAHSDWIFCSDSDCLSWVMDYIHLISKHYWFIKRLVDEGKVNLSHRPRNEDIMDLDRNDYEKLLMMLAVEPDPINYLISMIEQ